MEAEQIQVKLTRWDDQSLELVCGIANAGGGLILVAAEKKDYVTGFRKMRRPFEQIPIVTRDELGIICTTAPVMDGSQLCLEIEVPAATDPVSYLDDYWLYTKTGNALKTRESILQIWEEKANPSWELRTLPFTEQNDLSEEMLQEIEGIPLSSFEQSSSSISNTITDRLIHLHLVNPRTKELVNAGALLLCKNPARFIPGASIRIASFDESGLETDSHTEVTGPLSHQLSKAVHLIFHQYLPAISTAQAFTKQLPPEDAVREAIANALIHKNYEGGIPVRITVSPNRLSINNQGRPPIEWTAEDLQSHHTPRPQNPVLANAARFLHITAGWGSGINGIQQSCKSCGTPTPLFELTSDETSVTFSLPASKRGVDAVRSKRRKRAEAELIANSHTPLNHSAPQAKRIRSTAQSSSQSSKSNGSFPFNDGGHPSMLTFAEKSIAAANKLDMTSTDEYVLRVLTTNGRATAPRIAEVLGVSESTVRRSFRRLKEYGFIERIGSDKAGYWSIIE